MLVGPARCFIFYSNSFAKAIWWWMLYRTLRKEACTNMIKNVYVVTPRCAAAAAVVSAAVLRRPTEEYTHRYSMMHRRLTTYCRYCGRASLPPINSSNRILLVISHNLPRADTTQQPRVLFDIIHEKPTISYPKYPQ